LDFSIFISKTVLGYLTYIGSIAKLQLLYISHVKTPLIADKNHEIDEFETVIAVKIRGF